MSGENGNSTTAIERKTFDSTELAPIVETSAVAVAAQAEAEVKARVSLAIRYPRDMDNVRLKLLKECDRSRFAEVARYARPVGKEKNKVTGVWEEKIAEGFSIRFAEAAQRSMGNLYATAVVVYDGQDKRIIRASCMDLESNSTFAQDITITKTVERRKLKEEQKPLAIRQNSYGDTVYVIESTDAELTVKQGAETSKVLRNLILRHVPGDVLDECEERIEATITAGDEKDPNAARKKIVDSFAAIGVKPADLKLYLGHDIDGCSPDEMQTLRAIFTGIKEGAATWTEVLGERQAAANEPAKGGKVEQLKEQLRKKKPTMDPKADESA